MSGRIRLDPALAGLLLAPLLLFTGIAVMLVGAAVGLHPLWPDEQPTVSEAVVMRDLGALTRWLQAGADMRRRYSVRPGMIDARHLQLTPFEAAVAARRDDVLLYLRERGVEPAAEDLPRLRCLAAQTQATDVLTLLGGAPDLSTCGPPTAPPW